MDDAGWAGGAADVAAVLWGLGLPTGQRNWPGHWRWASLQSQAAPVPPVERPRRGRSLGDESSGGRAWAYLQRPAWGGRRAVPELGAGSCASHCSQEPRWTESLASALQT